MFFEKNREKEIYESSVSLREGNLTQKNKYEKKNFGAQFLFKFTM